MATALDILVRKSDAKIEKLLAGAGYYCIYRMKKNLHIGGDGDAFKIDEIIAQALYHLVDV